MSDAPDTVEDEIYALSLQKFRWKTALPRSWVSHGQAAADLYDQVKVTDDVMATLWWTTGRRTDRRR